MATGKVKGFKSKAVENILSQITKTSGNSTMTSAEFSIAGNTATLTFSIKATADVSGGNDAWTGTVPTEFRPKCVARGVGFSGTAVLVGVIYPDGGLVARVVNTTFPNTWSASISITYIVP